MQECFWENQSPKNKNGSKRNKHKKRIKIQYKIVSMRIKTQHKIVFKRNKNQYRICLREWKLNTRIVLRLKTQYKNVYKQIKLNTRMFLRESNLNTANWCIHSEFNKCVCLKRLRETLLRETTFPSSARNCFTLSMDWGISP